MAAKPADPSAEARKMIQKAHGRDGIPEMLVGIGFLCVAAICWAQLQWPKTGGFGMAVFVPLLCFAGPAFVRWLREKYLLERVGYVRPKPPGVKTGLTAALVAGVIAMGVAVAFIRGVISEQWLIGATGVFSGALVMFAGKLPRFVIGGMLIGAAGVGIGLLGLSIPESLAMLFGFQGALALVSGVIVFRRFVQE